MCEKVQTSLQYRDRATFEAIHRIVSDLLDEIEEKGGITQIPLDWLTSFNQLLCADCRNSWCCRIPEVVGLSLDDILRLSAHLDVSVEDFIKQHIKRIVKPNRGLTYEFKNTRPCVFLDKENRCSVYPARPAVCKNFPLASDKKGGRIVGANEWCNCFFNMVRYEAVLRVLACANQGNKS